MTVATAGIEVTRDFMVSDASARISFRLGSPTFASVLSNQRSASASGLDGGADLQSDAYTKPGSAKARKVSFTSSGNPSIFSLGRRRVGKLSAICASRDACLYVETTSLMPHCADNM